MKKILPILFSLLLSVSAVAQVSFSPIDTFYCDSQYPDTFQLSGGMPLGGYYAGAGVVDSLYFITDSLLGATELLYILDDDTAFFTAHVVGNPPVNLEYSYYGECYTCPGQIQPTNFNLFTIPDSLQYLYDYAKTIMHYNGTSNVISTHFPEDTIITFYPHLVDHTLDCVDVIYNIRFFNQNVATINQGTCGTTQMTYDTVSSNACFCEDNYILFYGYDSYGDGWQGNTYSISMDGVEVASGGLDNGDEFIDELCLPTGCYSVEVGGGIWTEEVSFDFGSLEDAVAGSYSYVAVGDTTCPFLGCTDSDALNYNSDATEDDGSCEYPCSYYGMENIATGGGQWNFEGEVLIEDCDGNTLFEGAGAFSDCVALTETYIITLTSNYGNGWNGNILIISDNSYTLEDGSIWSDTIGVFGCEGDCINDIDNDGICDENEIAGCTDASACNFNTDATDEDGSCYYPEPATITNAISCNNYLFIDTLLTESGSYTQTFTATNGCDSLITLNLSIFSSTEAGFNITACESYEWNGQLYTESDTYTYTTQNANGCDSLLTLHLNILEESSSFTEIVSCDNYTWNEQVYEESGNYTYITNNANACDSVATLSLTINDTYNSVENVTSCEAYEWMDSLYNQSGNYTQSYINAQACDSTLTLNLIVSSPPTATISSSGASLVAIGGNGFSYEWNTGETGQGIVPNNNGTYWVLITNAEGCVSDTTFYDYQGVGITEWNKNLSIYPNPVKNTLHTNLVGNKKVYNLIGEVVLESDKQALDVSLFPPGIYLLESKGEFLKFVKH